MFDVLVYLYETYWRPEACPSSELLTRKLAAVGFEGEDIAEALDWLAGIGGVSTSPMGKQSPSALRVYTAAEQSKLGPECLSFLTFLESAGVLAPSLREAVVDRCIPINNSTMSLDDFKIVVLMVFWSLGEEPDALILDELFVDADDRLLH